MDAARLRKTFKYPEDDDRSVGSRDEFDEEEQEILISNLQSRSQTSNAAYVLIFTVLPLVLTPLFVFYLVFSSTAPARLRLLCLLALTSLLASSFIMFFMSSIDGTDARARLDLRQKQLARNTFIAQSSTAVASAFDRLWVLAQTVVDKLDDVRLDLDAEGPLLKALPILNAVICGLLAVAAWALRRSNANGVPEYMWVWLLLPGAMAAMTMVARKGIIDEERALKELRGLRYGYKGA